MLCSSTPGTPQMTVLVKANDSIVWETFIDIVNASSNNVAVCINEQVRVSFKSIS
jgi:hypothetical protein